MICAYSRLYLEKARIAMARMLDYAVYDLEYKIDEFYKLFLNSSIAERFAKGDFLIVAGKSGVEIARLVIEEITGIYNETKPKYTAEKSPEYWAGWALSYFQWKTSLSFDEIYEFINMQEIVDLYHPYHEMDIRHFCDFMTKRYKEKFPDTKLKRYRKLLEMTQKQLAERSGIPVRSIQQYEQRQKDINKAQFLTVVMLAKALYCQPEELLEKLN